MLQHVEVSGLHPAVTADEAIDVLRKIEERVSLTGIVRSVRVEPLDDGARASHWEVKFRSGLLRWAQRDEFSDDGRAMRFTRLSGDPAVFEGEWRAADEPGGCRITFVCDFDLGIPSLAATLDPLAVRILRETIVGQLHDIFGEELRVDAGAPSAAAAAGSSNGRGLAGVAEERP